MEKLVYWHFCCSPLQHLPRMTWQGTSFFSNYNIYTLFMSDSTGMLICKTFLHAPFSWSKMKLWRNTDNFLKETNCLSMNSVDANEAWNLRKKSKAEPSTCSSHWFTSYSCNHGRSQESENRRDRHNLWLLYEKKGQIRISAFTFFRESELAMICQNLLLESVYFQSLNLNVWMKILASGNDCSVTPAHLIKNDEYFKNNVLI